VHHISAVAFTRALVGVGAREFENLKDVGLR
jgi:hypothetical protein